MSASLLEQLREERSRAAAEVDKLDQIIAQMEGAEGGGESMTTPLPQFMQEDNTDWEWLFGGVIPTGATVLFAGEGKVGKSTLIIQMTLCLAVGRSPFYNCPVSRAAKVLYVAAEGARAALQNRIRKAADSLGVRLNQPGADFWAIQKKNVSDYRLGGRGLSRMIEESQAQLVVLDTINYFHRGNDNDNTDWKRHVMEPVRNLTAKYGCAFLLVDHQSKPSPERTGVHRIKGASAKKDDCDVVFQLDFVPGEPEESGKRILRLSASKYSPKQRWDLMFSEADARFG